MNEEEKELVEGIKQYPTHRELCLIHVIERLDEELDKKDKVIDSILDEVMQLYEIIRDKRCKKSYANSKEHLKEYYFKKAEEENE